MRRTTYVGGDDRCEHAQVLVCGLTVSKQFQGRSTRGGEGAGAPLHERRWFMARSICPEKKACRAAASWSPFLASLRVAKQGEGRQYLLEEGGRPR